MGGSTWGLRQRRGSEMESHCLDQTGASVAWHWYGDAPVFVEVGEAGIAVDHAMRR
jgi:hypothetical protein